jgi:hypothetical protein
MRLTFSEGNELISMVIIDPIGRVFMTRKEFHSDVHVHFENSEVECAWSIFDDIFIFNLDYVIAENRDINDVLLVEVPGGYVAMFPPQSINFERNWMHTAENYWWHEEVPDNISADNISWFTVPGGFLVVLVPLPEFFSEDYGEHTIGRLETSMSRCFDNEEEYLSPNEYGRGSDSANFNITADPDGRLIVHPFSRERDVYVREITNDLWEKRRIQAFEWGGDVTLLLMPNNPYVLDTSIPVPCHNELIMGFCACGSSH